ncbi:MAG TPA: PxKF domain-containing protein [Ramlibacter sp.]|nr:PxKF domain-containing protein [Ramlibacter sp.]
MPKPVLLLFTSMALTACGGGGGGLASDQPIVTETKALTGALDAQYWPSTAPSTYFSVFTGPISSPSVMQPIVATTAGVLSAVTLNLCTTDTAGSALLQIRRGSAFSNPVVATAQVARASIPLWGSAQCPGSSDMAKTGEAEVSFDLSSANVMLTAGEALSITLARSEAASATDYWMADFNGNTDASSGNWLVMVQYMGSQTDAFGYRLRHKAYVSPAASWNFSGFADPVQSQPAMNTVKAGSAIPLKFSFGEDKGLDIFKDTPSATVLNCDGSLPTTSTAQPIASRGGPDLRYDETTRQYTYLWKTEKGWANTCRQLAISFKDESTQKANFRFVR